MTCIHIKPHHLYTEPTLISNTFRPLIREYWENMKIPNWTSIQAYFASMVMMLETVAPCSQIIDQMILGNTGRSTLEGATDWERYAFQKNIGIYCQTYNIQTSKYKKLVIWKLCYDAMYPISSHWMGKTVEGIPLKDLKLHFLKIYFLLSNTCGKL